MVVFADGRQVGTLGGGSVEAGVRRQALLLLDHTEPSLLTFDLDDDYGWADGLICGGSMRFLAQPLPPDQPMPYFDALAQCVDAGSGCTEVVVLDAQRAGLPEGARLLFDRQGTLVATHCCKTCPDSVRENLESLSTRPRPRSHNGLAYLPILTRCRLLLVGAGHVGQAIAQLAHQVDFDIWVLDDRSTFACPERFPQAQQILVEPIGPYLEDFQADGDTYCVIVTRGHSQDREALQYLAGKPAAYVGMIGSRRKIQLILESLRRDGIPAAALDKVYAPLGLDIGSQTVAEIAVSIVAQLIGHRNRGPGAFPPPART